MVHTYLSIFFDRKRSWREFHYSRRLRPICFDEFQSFIDARIGGKYEQKSNFVKRLYDEYLSMFDHAVVTSIKKAKSVSNLFGLEKKPTTLNFYLDRGFSQENSKILLQKRQGNNTVQHLVNRGIDLDKARILHAERQARGTKSFRSRADVELINKRKGHTIENLRVKINPKTGILYTTEEAKNILDFRHQRHRKLLSQTIKRYKEIGKTWTYTTNLAYFLKKTNNDINLAKDLLRSRQTTFSLVKCKLRHGDILGEQVWKQRQERWLKTLNDKSQEEKLEISRKRVVHKNRKFFSIESKTYFEKLSSLLIELGYSQKLRYAEDEIFIIDDDRKFHFYDCAIRCENKILLIEYNGSHVHPDKRKISQENWFKWINPFTKESAEENFQRDEKKIRLAINRGYEILSVWDHEAEELLPKILSKIKDLTS